MQQVAGKRFGALLALFVVLASSLAVVAANELKSEQQQQQQQEAKYISVPANLVRFLFYNSKPSLSAERQQASLMGYKRSSGALDALTGVTLGKRSSPSAGWASDYLNLEPFFGRHYAIRSSPRPYDYRWADLEPSSATLVGGPSDA